MSQLLFLHSELIDPLVYHKQLRIPLEFVCFGITEGKMYKHFNSYADSTFILPKGDTKDWGNTVVYGALFLIKEFDFYIDLLDAYHACSLSKIRRNHIRDIHHRLQVKVTPIYYDTLDDLSRLKYKEGTSINAITYVGNLNHPKINQRFVTTASYRIVDGINKESYTKLFRRVKE